MKRFLLLAGLILSLGWTCVAQTNAADSPATKEDVERYLQVVQSHDMLKKVLAVMSQARHQMLHEQYLQHKDDLPTDYESKMTARMDQMLDNMPWDEITQAMVPAYEKHFTKGDIDNLIAFYATPTGQKLLRELPTIMAEAMQDMMPVMTKYLETVQQRLQKETDDMIAQSRKRSHASAPANRN